MEFKHSGFYRLDGNLCRIYKDGKLTLIMYFTSDVGVSVRVAGESFFKERDVDHLQYTSYHYLEYVKKMFSVEDLNDIPLIKAIYGS